MAFYCYNSLDESNHYHNNFSYNSNYDFANSNHSLIHYSNVNNFFGYDHNPHPPPTHYSPSYYYSYTPTQPTVSYSVSPVNESESIVVNPNYSTYHDPYATRFIVSYSNAEFNVPEFEDYDPSPYGGGYDQALTYGKPLSPSDEICYPHSDKKRPGSSPSVDTVPEPMSEPPGKGAGSEGEGQIQPEKEDSDPDPTGSGQIVESPHDGYFGGNWIGTVPPPGCGLDAVDICDGLFGYFPCLARDIKRRQSCPPKFRNGGGCRGNRNQWQEASDYLFGTLDPYEERRSYDGEISNEDSISWYGYGQERQYEDQEIRYGQVGCDGDSWFDRFKIC